MAWRQHFIDWLGERVTYPQYRIEVAPVDAYLPGAAINFGSHPGVLGIPGAIVARGSRITGGTLSPIDWSYSIGTASIGLRSDTDPRKTLPRGCLVRIMMGAAGWDDELFEPVFFGQFQDAVFDGDIWRIELRSIVGSLQSRFSQVYGSAGIFYDLGYAPQTALTAGYTAGDATLNVVSTTGLEQLTGGSYLVQVYPDSGDPFFLEATGLTPTTITGCSAAGQIGTTAADAATGNSVVLCAFLEQNPIDAVLIVLTSTGTALNGDYDLGPDSWGLGLPVAYIDVDDCLTSREIITPASGSELFDVYAVEVQQDASAWLQTILQPAGLWLCERQGLLTIRAVREVEGYAYYLTHSIQDADIISVSYNAWDPAHQAEYANVEVASATSSSFDTVAELTSRPALPIRTYELPYCEENESAWRTKTLERLSEHAQRIGEVVKIVCAGWRLAELTPGDEVVLYTRFVEVWDGRLANNGLVLSVQPDWFGSTVELTVRFNPIRPEFSS